MSSLINQLKHPSRELILLCFILLMGSFLRLYQLGQVPAGFTWDEAAITYDAWGIQDWHRDQHVAFMPLVFKSFGDYKAPLLHYLLATTFFITGPQEITIRLISAIAGISLILISYLIARELFPQAKYAPLLTALLVCISPWNIHMSRIGFEANVAVTLNTLAVWLILKSKQKFIFFYPALLFFGAAFYTYQSTKLTIPLMLLLSLWYLWQPIREAKKRHWLLVLVCLSLIFAPFVSSLGQGGVERGKQALIFFEANQFVLNQSVLSQALTNLARHLHPDFLLLGKQDNQRNIVPGFGILLLIELPLLVIGLATLGRKNKNHQLLVGWLLIALVPSIMSTTSPHTLRAASLLPVIQLIESSGISYVIKRIKSKSKQYWLLAIIVSCLLINSVWFYRHYLTVYKKTSAPDFQYGYKQAVDAIKTHGRDVDHIYFTDAYQQAYIYVLLYRRLTPEAFQAGALANMSFLPIRWPTQENDVLYIAAPNEIPPTDPAVVEVIKYPDSDQVVFVIAKKP